MSNVDQTITEWAGSGQRTLGAWVEVASLRVTPGELAGRVLEATQQQTGSAVACGNQLPAALLEVPSQQIKSD